MSNIPALGARSLPASLYPAANALADGKTGSASSKQLSGLADTPISLSSDGIDLQKRVASVGNATIDYAQNLLGSFAEKLFGGAGKGASISFDTASLETESSYALGVSHSQGPNGSSDAAAFQLTDSSHFLGKGTITTADGRKFDFEVEVQYNYELDAAASQTTSAGQGQTPQPDSAPVTGAGDSSKSDLPTVQVPNIDFPGTLADLFKLIGHDLQSALSNGQSSDQTGNGIDRNTLRNLSLRLLSLVDSKDTDTYTAPTAAETLAKSVASAYGVAPADAAKAPAATPAGADAAAAPAAAPEPSSTQAGDNTAAAAS